MYCSRTVPDKEKSWELGSRRPRHAATTARGGMCAGPRVQQHKREKADPEAAPQIGGRHMRRVSSGDACATRVRGEPTPLRLCLCVVCEPTLAPVSVPRGRIASLFLTKKVLVATQTVRAMCRRDALVTLTRIRLRKTGAAEVGGKQAWAWPSHLPDLMRSIGFSHG